MARGPAFGARKFLKGIAKETDLRGPWIKKSDEGRNINNLFSGYDFGSRSKGVAGIAVLGVGGYQIASADDKATEAEILAQSEHGDIQSLPGTRGDMMGYQTHTGNPSNQLESNGDLVFALHKIRHGG